MKEKTMVFVLMCSGIWDMDGTEEHKAPRTTVLGVWTNKTMAERYRDSTPRDPHWTGVTAEWTEEVALDALPAMNQE